MNEIQRITHTKDLVKKTAELNDLLDIAWANNIIVDLNIDVNDRVRLLSAKSTVMYYTYEEGMRP